MHTAAAARAAAALLPAAGPRTHPSPPRRAAVMVVGCDEGTEGFAAERRMRNAATNTHTLTMLPAKECNVLDLLKHHVLVVSASALGQLQARFENERFVGHITGKGEQYAPVPLRPVSEHVLRDMRQPVPRRRMVDPIKAAMAAVAEVEGR